jgi:hypothetical protein
MGVLARWLWTTVDLELSDSGSIYPAGVQHVEH